MPTLTTPRMTFHYRTHGDADGLPMLLLHGSFASSRWWEPFFAILPDEIYALAPDLRGCGGSSHSDDGYAIHGQAGDVAAFVEGLGLEDFDLVGHSSGGAIAVEYVLTHPGHARSLILVDSAPIEGVFTPLEGYQLLEQMRTDRALLRQALASLMPATPPPTMTAEEFQPFFERLAHDAAGMAPAAFTAVAHALQQWNRFEEARYLSLPCLLLWGALDTLVDRESTTRMLIAIPGAANLEVLAGVGHSPMIESPVALAERIIDFITEDFRSYEEARTIAGEEFAPDE
ncbi:MAG: alpha/beta hydrolase [Caldilineaceae bacterium]|nr:alpha/beta hydrolase [Caldilineaceae bacterium]HRJ42100.1 alpha/beta hydrolase [Caldilineaceae bacterium]